MSPVIDCTDEQGREGGIAAAAAALRAGQLVVVPTDTVYGVAADAFDETAVAALMESKGRGREMPPPVLIPSTRTIDGLATQVPSYARRLIDAFWPGALTIIVRAQASLMWDLGDNNGTVALRMPDDALALMLLSETGPLAVTSANRTGQPAARTVVEAATALGPAVEVYLDGGPSAGGLPSTIVDCTGAEPVVLRHGAICDEDLFAALKDPRTGPEDAPLIDPATDPAGAAHPGPPESEDPERGPES